MLFRKKPAEERSPQELEIALQEAEMPQKGLKPFLHKNGKKLVAVLVIAAILVVLLVPKGQKKAVNAETAYTQVTPENRDITNVYSESGVLNAANSYTVKATVKGDVLTADFEVGDVVEKGAVLYTIDSSDVVSGVEKAELNLGQAQRSYDDAVDAQYIRTDIAGTVASFKVRVGDVVNAGQEVATIRDDTTLLLELEFPAADAANFAVGQSAEVLLDSTFEAITGSVQSVSGADTLSSGNLLVRTVTIAVRNTGNLTASQAATATINGVSALSSARFSYQREQSVTAQNSGTVSALCVKEGAQVSADTALIQLSGDNLTKQVLNASDNLRSAELSVEDTQKQVDNYTITAPISGTIISKDVKVGDTVGTSTATADTMCVIYDMSYLEMTLNVDELDILNIKEGRHEMLGFIFQQYNLLPKLSLLENVEVPLVYAGVPLAERKRRATASLERVGLGDKLKNKPNQLSGGQQQRVSIARALAGNPAVILADEPTGALDSHTGREVLGMLQELHRQGNTVVLITHDNSIAVQAQRIIRLEDGRVVYDGDAHAPEAVVQPNLVIPDPVKPQNETKQEGSV